MTTSTPPADPDRSPLLALVAVASILVLAVIFAGPVHAKLSALGYPAKSFGLRYLAVTMLGALVGFAELALRYRDEPAEAAGSGPGIVFVLLNGAAAALALFLVEYFGARAPAPGQPGPPIQISDTVQRVIMSGLGAMVVLRGRLLSVAGPGDTKTEIGFAPLVEAILAAVNRSIDRGRAHERIGLVTDLSRRMAPLSFAEVAPFLKVGLQSLQTLDKTQQERVLGNLEKLEKDDKVADAVRFEAAGYDLLNNFGEKCFGTLFREARISAGLVQKATGGGAQTLAGAASPAGGGAVSVGGATLAGAPAPTGTPVGSAQSAAQADYDDSLRGIAVADAPAATVTGSAAADAAVGQVGLRPTSVGDPSVPGSR